MQVVSELISGVRGAELGQASIYRRATSTLANVYADYDGTVVLAQPLSLDSFGGVEAYVNEEVDVRVQNENGTVIRQFSPMQTANSVEYIGKAFTGARYSDAAAGVNEPTSVQAILDLWETTNGAPDWKVLFGGSAVSVQEAVAGIAGVFFNVKDPIYGAVGDGIEDDTVAIQAAMTAAGAVKGIVLFPTGTYRVTATLTVPVGVSLWGMGGSGSVVAMDHATNDLLEYGAGTSDSAQEIRNLGLSVLQANTGTILSITDAGNRILNVYGCLMGDSAGLHTTDTIVIALGQLLLADSQVWCKTSGGINAVGALALVLLDMRNVTVRTVNGAYSGAMVSINYGSIIGCKLIATSTSGTYNGIFVDGTPALGDPLVEIVGNYLTGSTGTTIAIQVGNLNASGTRVREAANSFLGWTVNYGGWFMQSNNPQLQNSSRDAAVGTVSDNSASVDLLGDLYGVVVLERTAAGGAQTLTSLVGAPGSFLTVIIYNNSGGVLGADPVTGTGFYSALTITKPTNGKISVAHFRACYAAGTGAWVPLSAPKTDF